MARAVLLRFVVSAFPFVLFCFRMPWKCTYLQLNSRWTKFLSVTVPFVTRVVKDYTSGNIMRNEGELARDLRIVIEKLGPTFIKARSVAGTALLSCFHGCFSCRTYADGAFSCSSARCAQHQHPVKACTLYPRRRSYTRRCMWSVASWHRLVHSPPLLACLW